MKQRIVFIGLGNMGLGMAMNLAESHFEVAVHDLSSSAMSKAEAAGCIAMPSAASAAEEADIVISMLPNGAIVEDVYLGDGGLLGKLLRGKLVIDCSTVSPETSRRLAAAGKVRGVSVVDAPVSGGTAAAAAGTLAFMCGADVASYERAKPVLQVMGKNIFHAGEHGAGQIAKICNNMLLAILMAGTAEAIQLGVNNGLNPQVLSEIISKSSGSNWVLEKYNPYPGVSAQVPASRGYTGGFLVDLMCKDLSLAMCSALDSDSYTPMGALANNLFGLHRSGNGMTNGGLDFSSIQQLFPKNSNL